VGSEVVDGLGCGVDEGGGQVEGGPPQRLERGGRATDAAAGDEPPAE
jgi:hypothetical protein